MSGIHERPIELLANLLRFDTTNPPGNEAACIKYIDGLLTQAGIETTLLARDPQRPNLLARLKGRGDAPPLLLYGHVDVVTTANQDWTYPPFDATIADGFMWGRGTLDMKGAVSMMIAAFLRAHTEEVDLPGDVLLCILSDEEGGAEWGAKWLVENHPEQFEGVRYALGEFGGFTLSVSGKRFFPIMVGEKLPCWTRATIRGPAGHAAMPIRDGTVSTLGQVLTKLTANRLPVHVTPYARQMFSALADEMDFPANVLIRGLLNPTLTDPLLNLLGERGALFDPLLHHTVSPTMIEASDKINVIPSLVEIGLDIRLLPGFTPDDVYQEIRALLGPVEIEFEPIEYIAGPTEPDMGLYPTLATILREKEPDISPVPYMLPAVTDGRFFSTLGIQTYGYTPMVLPEAFSFQGTIHAADERIPVDAVDFGAHAMFEALRRFGEGS